MSAIVKVGRRYTIVIPKEIRSKLKIKENSKVLVRVVEGKIVIEPLPDNPFEVLGKVIGKPYNEDVDEKKAEKWLFKHARG